MFVEAADSDL